MPDISLLEPAILRETVQKIPVAQDKILLNRVPKTVTPYPYVIWDVVRGARTMATVNVPNSEAHIVPRLGVEQERAGLLYLREKKVFQPTTIHWLKAQGTISNRENAEQAVLKEVTDLNARFDNFWEWTLWQAIQGRIVIDAVDVQADVDFKFSASHKPTASTPWANATPQQIIANVTAWKQLLLRDGNVDTTEAFLTTATLGYIVNAFVNNGINLMTDALKSEYYRTGNITGFLGMNWTTVDTAYDVRQADGSFNQVGFLADNKIIFSNLTANNPISLVQGLSADDDAPDGFVGRFAKTWKEKDPSARQYLLEEHAFPIITRPEQFLIATVG